MMQRQSHQLQHSPAAWEETSLLMDLAANAQAAVKEAQEKLGQQVDPVANSVRLLVKAIKREEDHKRELGKSNRQ